MDEFKTETEKYSKKNPLYRLFVKRFLDNVNDFVKEVDAEHILDAGCGIGEVIKSIKKVKKESNITGLDILEESLETAKRTNPECSFILGDVYALPFAGQSFDLVINCQVLEHLKEPEKALNELKRVSKQYCLVCVPNEPLFSVANLLRLKYLAHFGNYPGHVQKWSKKGFRRLLKNHFEEVKIKTSSFWLIALCRKC